MDLVRWLPVLAPRGAYFRKVLSTRPIAYWPLWETSGGVAGGEG